MKIILNHKNMSLDIPIAKQCYPIKYMCDYFKMAQSLALHIKAHVIVNHYENVWKSLNFHKEEKNM